MGNVALEALATYPYAGKSLKVGDTFEASEKDAELLKKVGRAKDAKRRIITTREMAPEQPATPEELPEKPRRAYRRRDMIAETINGSNE